MPGTPRGPRPPHTLPVASNVDRLRRLFPGREVEVARQFESSATSPTVRDYWARVIDALDWGIR